MVRASKAPNQEPITVALRRLLDEHGATLRGVAGRTRELDETGKGMNHTYISAVLNGRESPSPRSLELIARVFDIDPDFFVEYRMGKMREEINPRVVGFDAALRRFVDLSGEDGAKTSPTLSHST
jgi:transcriptional regulator with XRE-family HTH domain